MDCPICQVIGNNDIHIQRFVTQYLRTKIPDEGILTQENDKDRPSVRSRGSSILFDDLRELEQTGSRRRAGDTQIHIHRDEKSVDGRSAVVNISPGDTCLITGETNVMELHTLDFDGLCKVGPENKPNYRRDSTQKARGSEAVFVREETTNRFSEKGKLAQVGKKLTGSGMRSCKSRSVETTDIVEGSQRKRVLPVILKRSSSRNIAATGERNEKTPKRACYGVNRKQRQELLPVECDMCKGWQEGMRQLNLDGRNQCRHRFEAVPVSTPKGYWDVAFPPTQKTS